MRRKFLVLFALASLAAAPAAQARTLYGSESEAESSRAVLQMSQLPTWVQVTAGEPAQMYAADSGSVLASPIGARAFTFLRVLGGGLSRLHVDQYDDTGRVVLRGWVEADSVMPSAPGTDWLVVAADTTPLFRSLAATDVVRTIDRFSALQAIDGPVQGRVAVRLFRSDFAAVEQGWVVVADTGRALAPQTRVPALSMPTRPAGPSTPSQAAFLAAASEAAIAGARATRVPASVTVAQAILESDWGRSSLSADAHNYFGMKAMGTLGNDGVVWLPTSEYDDNGNLYQTVSAFRAYRSLSDSLLDHDRLLQSAPRYATAMQVASDAGQFAQQLYESGYSTDPAYPEKLVSIMDAYNLYRLDG